MKLITDSFPGRPAFDNAVSRALLVGASEGRIGPTLRLYRPERVLAFGVQDSRSPGFDRAQQAAREQRFAPIMRLAGGRAAVFHEGTIAFARTIPDPDPHQRTFARFDETARLMASALAKLGVDARVGEVPGEYCPGDFSVNASGKLKLVGIGQRIIRGAAHVGGVIVVSDSSSVRDVLIPVYDALGLTWDPATVGAVDEVVECSYDDVYESVRSTMDAEFGLEPGQLDAETLTLAERLTEGAEL